TPGATQDTPGTALDLGNLGNLGGKLVQVSGFIGDDPADPPGGEASEVDLYHFRITAPGTYALGAEVFAGRIGSPLDPPPTLFRRDTDGTLALVASNGNTDNSAVATNWMMPLYLDAGLLAPLGPGEYYLAVGSGFNYVDPEGGLFAGRDGVFDPTISHSD